jgi:APA family basic amino acid/polyamine antiporter
MCWKQLFRTKPLEMILAEAHGDHRLRRILGPISLTSLGVGAILGAGIFVITGRAAREDAGPAIMVSYAVAGLGCALAALCYAEFASMVPAAGSAYTYAYATLGELVAWVIGWDLILEYAMSCATVASGWSGHFDEFLRASCGWHIPGVVATDPFTSPAALVNLPAMLIVAAVTIVLVLGIRQSALTNAVLVAVKLAVILAVIAVGWWYIDLANWTGIAVEGRLLPADPVRKWGMLGLLGLDRSLLALDDHVRSPFAPYGVSGIMLGASIVFFSYIGFDSISTHAEEAKKPQRDLPVGILTSLVLCTVLYVAVAAILTGMVPYPRIDERAGVAAAFADLAARQGGLGLRVLAVLIAAGALAGITSVLLVTFLSQARIFLAMARDGLLPRGAFGTVHPRFRTPHVSTILTGVVVAAAAGFTPIADLQNLVNIGTLTAFLLVCAAVLVLRRKRPDAPRPFRCPAVHFVAPLGIAVNLLMMLFLPWQTWLRLGVWLALGLAVYFTYGHRHSLLRRREEVPGPKKQVEPLRSVPGARP